MSREFRLTVECAIHFDGQVECTNQQALLDAVLDRGDRGLLTVSNHMSVYDDPGLWSALIPFWR